VPASDVPQLRLFAEYAWVQAIAPLRGTQVETSYLFFGRRRGGRRYLSEDLQSLNRLTSAVVTRLERFRNSEMRRLVSQAELRALHAQINPHFLFNSLNALYGLIPREASGARQTVLNLAEIFRYFLRTDRTLIAFSGELEIVKCRLAIERLRLGPRLEVNIDVDKEALQVEIPVLSVQPLVENAIKHGLAPTQGYGLLNVIAKVRDGQLFVEVRDSGAGEALSPRTHDRSGSGVGLANVRKRLQLCFGTRSELVVESSPDGTRVHFAIPLKSVHGLTVEPAVSK
jgi:LytS/YehU family sensor histidine kinase